ncbi:MAG: amino acid permease [Paenibacillus macerans]|uniref:Amino acid permease n=1 Tax=Paenibacillus macerans TaxID=44252 RepID=A0A090ZGY0_PAEMA|nr:amino acid permease [Paenibacillus macerans]KFN09638.1 amino acid permease family protein [Paenibacillus macerans]MBS5912701.1 amino acid permease [Paenibacillus macerans]MCY7557907.1 amino acid permease [Paenibacillus macerans]MDU7473581.1 amino acid permease [Paenibacillus macerans]MEC0140657.1 amino acid permease [Paenibacillus macerans]
MAKTGEAKAGLTTFHLTMMALGTVVGGSFFLGSGVGIKAAGPAILLAYLIGGVLVYIILYALSEMTVADPVSGSFRTYAERSYGAGAGFVTGWVYWIGLIFAMSSESIAASTFLRVWFPNLSPGVAGTVIIVGVTLLNLLGAQHLSKLESSLAAVKLIAIAGFIAIGLAIIAGLMPGAPAVGAGELRSEPWLPGGIAGIAGSMLTVVLTYAGFEVIGLAASEVRNPRKTIPRAINLTLISLIGLYVGAIAVILPLFPSRGIIADESPLVLSLTRWGMGWAGTLMNIVMITAILSTMLAAMFGLGRMIRSLAGEGHAPNWLKDETDVPYRGILFSGAAMLAGLGLGYLLPQQVYLFLLSLGGFSLLFSYFMILAAHYKWRRRTPCSPEAACQLPGFPYTSWLGLTALVAIIASMPFIPGQGTGLIIGLILVALLAGTYYLKTWIAGRRAPGMGQYSGNAPGRKGRVGMPLAQMEAAEEVANSDRPSRKGPDEPK